MGVITDTHILLMVEKDILHTILRFMKANSKYMDDYEESSYLNYCDVNKLYDGQCHKNWL